MCDSKIWSSLSHFFFLTSYNSRQISKYNSIYNFTPRIFNTRAYFNNFILHVCYIYVLQKY